MSLKGKLAAALASLCIAACGGDHDEGEATGSECPDNSTVTYEDDIKPFMAKYCTSCHGSNVPAIERQGAPSDHNFDTEEGILEEASHVADEAAAGPDGVNTGMPEGNGPKPSEAERRMLGEWLACNADHAADEDHEH
jgi:uncharacterized membrane protein